MTQNTLLSPYKVRRRALLQWVAVLSIVVLALAVRLPRLDAFITPDEMKWVCRSINFYRGLRAGDLAQTFQTGHPGVITMWLGAPLMQVDLEAPWLEACRVPAIARIIEESPPELPNELAALLFRARRGVALWTSAFLGLAVWLLARRAGWPLALIAGILVALDPFYIAHSRFLHLDAIETSLLFPSVLCFLEGLASGRKRFFALAGVLLGLAMLNKSPAMFGIGFFGLLTLIYSLYSKRPFSWLVRCTLSWLLPACVTYGALWPALWVQPLQTVQNVLNTALFYASRPHVNSNYFWGAPRPDPGWAFYPVALAFRLTPWAMIGALGGGILVAYRREKKAFWGALGLFIALYGLFMTLGEKKFDRYLLPVFPFVQVFAGYGILALVEWAMRRIRRVGLAPIVAGGLTLGLGMTILAEAPYYLTYYNPLVGGKRAAVRTLLVGWGEGLDQAAAYLNSLPGSENSIVASRSLPGLAPFYHGRAIHQTNYDPATVRYVVFYLNEVQRRLEPDLLAAYYDRQAPIHVVRVKGIDYAWIYENKTYEAPLAEIAAQAQPGDALVVSRPSLISESYRGPLALVTLDPTATREEMLSTLQEIAEGHPRVWYIVYAEKNPNPLQEWLIYQWRTHARLLARQEFPQITLSVWDTSHALPFTSSHRAPVALDLRFGEDLALRGYTAEGPARWDHAVGLALEWQVLQRPSRYYACYIHVLDEAGHRVGQGDTWMVDASLRPTVDWEAGALIHEDLALDLLPGLAPGTYRLVMGVYDRISGEAIPIEAPGGQRQAEVMIGTLEVQPSGAPWSLEEMGFLPTDLTLAPGVRLVGYGYAPHEPAFGEVLTLKLAWDAPDATLWGYTLALEVAQGGKALSREEYPFITTISSMPLPERPGMFWRFYDLPISEDALWGEAELRLALRDAQGRTVSGPLVFTRLFLHGHRFEEPMIPYRQEASIGQGVRFLGYDLAPHEVRPGGTITLTVYWQAVKPITRSLTVFTHLLDEGGVVRGQKDGIPKAGHYPTHAWREGEYLVDEYLIPVQADAPPGTYHIEIGMYDATLPNAPREPLLVGGTRQPEDRLILEHTVNVAP